MREAAIGVTKEDKKTKTNLGFEQLKSGFAITIMIDITNFRTTIFWI
jgi:hypothetical protein